MIILKLKKYKIRQKEIFLNVSFTLQMSKSIMVTSGDHIKNKKSNFVLNIINEQNQ